MIYVTSADGGTKTRWANAFSSSPGSADVVQISVGGNVDFIMIFDAEFGL